MNWFFWQDPNTRLYRAGCGHKTRLTGMVRSEKTEIISGVAIVPTDGEIPFCHKCLAAMTLPCDCCNHSSEIFPYDPCFKTNLVMKKIKSGSEEFFGSRINLGYAIVICSICGEKLWRSPELKDCLIPGRWMPRKGKCEFVPDDQSG